MSRYPDNRRPANRPAQKKRAAAPAAQQIRSPARPQQSRPAQKKAAAPAQKRAPARKQAAPVQKKRTPVQKPAQPQRKYSSLLLHLLSALAFPELVLHLATAKSSDLLLNSGLLLGPIFAVLPAAVLFAVCTSLPRKGQNFFVTLLYTFLCYLLCASQLVYYRVFGTFYTFYSMTNGAGAFQFVATITTAITENLLTLALMAAPLLLLLFGGRQRYWFKRRTAFAQKAALVALAVVVQLLAVAALPMLGGREDTSAYGLYHNASDAYLGVNKLGLFTAFRLDMTRTLTGKGAEGSIDLGDPVPVETTGPDETQGEHQFLTPEENGTTPAETTAPTLPPETTEPAPAYDTSPNVLDIDFDALIAAEDRNAVQEVHQYFASRTPSNKNEKTGMFEGCNLILITAEAYSHLMVDPVRTPTLYKLTHEGFYFSNYYVPDWGVSTTDGEYAHLTGTIPKDGVWSFKRSAGNYMPLTMNQQLMKLGYSSYAYHGHTYTYYDRDKYLTNLGYNYKGLGNGLEVTKQWPESDIEVVDLSTGDYVGDTPFSVYYMTISGHREFTFGGNSMAAKNKALVADLPYSNNVRAYIACQLELENSMKLLLERLSEAGVLENTVIVLTADHYPNGLTAEELGELAGSTPEDNFEIYRNGCIIWKQGMTPETIDEPTSHLDLLPTLSNLFGLEFDSRLYMGRDVFSDAEPLVMFRNRSWITDVAQYNSQTGKAEFFGAAGTDSAYVKAINKEVGNRFAVSTRILDYDYWRILFEEN